MDLLSTELALNNDSSGAASPALTLTIISHQSPYGAYETWPAGYWRYKPPQAWWTYQPLNASVVSGNGSSVTATVRSSYVGWYYIRVEPGSYPVNATYTLRIDVSDGSGGDLNDNLSRAQPLGHSARIDGHLSQGLDTFDFYSMVIPANGFLSVKAYFTDPEALAGGYTRSLQEIAILDVNGSALAIANSQTTLSVGGKQSIELALSPPEIDPGGTYWIKFSMLHFSPFFDPSPIEVDYTAVLSVPNEAPIALSLPSFIRFDEDTAWAGNLSAWFQDPEGDQMQFFAGTSGLVFAFVSGPNLTLVAGADWNGNDTLLIDVYDWFGYKTSGSVAVTVGAVNDAPRVDFSALPTPLAWDQGNNSGNVSFAPFFYDVDGDPMALSTSIPPQLTAQVCGAFCLRFAGVDPSFFGAGAISLQASDPAGLSANLSMNYAILHVNHAPALLAPGFAPVNLLAGGPGTTLEPASFCADSDGDAMRLEAVALATAFLAEPMPAGGSDTGLGVSVPSVGDGGNWELQLRCVDSSGAGASFSLTAWVAFPNRAPLFEDAQPIPSALVAARENGSADFSAFFLDPDGDVLAYAWSLDGIPLGGAQGNGTRVAFDFSAAGQHLLVLTARDPSGLNTSVSWTIEVAEEDRPPVCGIGAPEGLDGPAGSTLNLTSESFDPDGTALAYSWLRNGSRLSITGSAQLIRQPGTWLVELVVTSGGVSASCQVSVVGDLEASPPLAEPSEGTAWGLLVLPGLAAAAVAGLGIAVWALRKRKGAA